MIDISSAQYGISYKRKVFNSSALSVELKKILAPRDIERVLVFFAHLHFSSPHYYLWNLVVAVLFCYRLRQREVRTAMSQSLDLLAKSRKVFY